MNHDQIISDVLDKSAQEEGYVDYEELTIFNSDYRKETKVYERAISKALACLSAEHEKEIDKWSKGHLECRDRIIELEDRLAARDAEWREAVKTELKIGCTGTSANCYNIYQSIKRKLSLTPSSSKGSDIKPDSVKADNSRIEDSQESESTVRRDKTEPEGIKEERQ